MRAKLIAYRNAAVKKPAYICAMLLDPRRKLSRSPPGLLDLAAARDLLVCEYREMVNGGPLNPEEPLGLDEQPVLSNPPGWFGGPPERYSTLQAEVHNYLFRPVEPMDIKPLDWWRLNQISYPHLTKLARQMLAVPATSVSSESHFSAGRRLMTNFRCGMTPDSLEQQICLKSWHPLLNEISCYSEED